MWQRKPWLSPSTLTGFAVIQWLRSHLVHLWLLLEDESSNTCSNLKFKWHKIIQQSQERVFNYEYTYICCNLLDNPKPKSTINLIWLNLKTQRGVYVFVCACVCEHACASTPSGQTVAACAVQSDPSSSHLINVSWLYRDSIACIPLSKTLSIKVWNSFAEYYSDSFLCERTQSDILGARH